MDGIINVYKEKGYTSHDAVAKLRGMLGQKKIGHTGTLDPDAEGVLPVCLGKATKVCGLITDWTKTYRTVLRLGIVTDTQDMSGTVLEEHEPGVSEEEIRKCISGFVGEQLQLPPMYSARKVGGRKLYELARRGVEVERQARSIRIDSIKIGRIALPEVEMTVVCSKGTYIRTLCHDIGAALGCGGCMQSLLRTRVGSFFLRDSLKLDEIESLKGKGELERILVPADSVFSSLQRLDLNPEAEKLVRNGNPLDEALVRSLLRDSAGEKELRVYGQDGSFLAVYGYSPERHSWRAVKMFL